MARRWIEEVRQTGQLSVFAEVNDVWSDAFRRAFIIFNLLAVARDLGVILIPSKAPRTLNGSTVSVKFGTFPPLTGPAGVAGTSFTEGLTQPFRRSGEERVASVIIAVPATPIVGDVHRHPVGEEPKVFMALHELIHACGLENADHTPQNTPDVFCGVWDLEVGVEPKDDRIRISTTIMPDADGNFRVGLGTIGKIRDNWKAA